MLAFKWFLWVDALLFFLACLRKIKQDGCVNNKGTFASSIVLLLLTSFILIDAMF